MPPIAASKFWIRRVVAGCVRLSRPAARLTEPVSATATKASMSCRFINRKHSTNAIMQEVYVATRRSTRQTVQLAATAATQQQLDGQSPHSSDACQTPACGRSASPRSTAGTRVDTQLRLRQLRADVRFGELRSPQTSDVPD